MYSFSSAWVTCWMAWSTAAGMELTGRGAATDPTIQNKRTVANRDNIATFKVYLIRCFRFPPSRKLRRARFVRGYASLEVLETGSWKLETGNWKLITGSCFSARTAYA